MNHSDLVRECNLKENQTLAFKLKKREQAEIQLKAAFDKFLHNPDAGQWASLENAMLCHQHMQHNVD